MKHQQLVIDRVFARTGLALLTSDLGTCMHMRSASIRPELTSVRQHAAAAQTAQAVQIAQTGVDLLEAAGAETHAYRRTPQAAGLRWGRRRFS